MKVTQELLLDLSMYGHAAALYTDSPSEFSIKRVTQDYIHDARDVQDDYERDFN